MKSNLTAKMIGFSQKYPPYSLRQHTNNANISTVSNRDHSNEEKFKCVCDYK